MPSNPFKRMAHVVESVPTYPEGDGLSSLSLSLASEGEGWGEMESCKASRRSTTTLSVREGQGRRRDEEAHLVVRRIILRRV